MQTARGIDGALLLLFSKIQFFHALLNALIVFFLVIDEERTMRGYCKQHSAGWAF